MSHQLVLAVGTTEFFLTAADLSKHPDSLLSSLISATVPVTDSGCTTSKEASASTFGCAGSSNVTAEKYRWLTAVEDGWRLDLDQLDIPIKGDFQVLDLTSAAGMLHAVYSQDVIPEATWEPLLGSYPATATPEEQSKHNTSGHADVSKLLDFFNIPGPVTKWLPPLSSLSLHHWRLLAFIYTCHVVQHVQEVVGPLMAYKPHQDALGASHTAVFVFSSCEPDLGGRPQPITPLAVHVLHPVPADFFVVIVKAKEQCVAGGGTSRIFHFDDSSLRINHVDSKFTAIKAMPLLADGRMAGEGIQASLLSSLELGTAVRRDDPDFGQHLVDQILAGLEGTGIMLGCGVVNLYNYGYRLPVWVLTW